ncbi:uncharacterized protein LOC131877083 isoform X2 [Tigriopus californicus]|uniref:uncharacterized protein LOC131877083 isoform X2 n=1 Tax=Tigriopus californicus TaxID=6832 RepID=UPI0027DA1B63|nr:uncharacterized protein LOC131877083 isoform X2 [Tigriopus californicus]
MMLSKALSIPIIVTSSATPPLPEESTDLEKVDEYDFEDDKENGPDETRAPTPLTFFTTVGIARWMARSYGYQKKKRALYVSQDKKVRRATLGTIRYPYSHMDLKSPSILSEQQKSCLSQKLSGIPEEDQKIIIDWFTCSYGGHDEAYYQAYSREVIRQTKKLMGTTEIPAWF